MGVNKLKTIITEISVEAGLQVRYTNHSLHATAVTRMYNTGVPENLIAEKSGHRSLKALCVYEKTSEDQEKLAGQSIEEGKEFRAVVVDKENCAPECGYMMALTLARPLHQMALVLASLALVPCNNFQDSHTAHLTFIKVE